jgi:transposase
MIILYLSVHKLNHYGDMIIMADKKTGIKIWQCEGPKGALPIADDDHVARKLAMLFEGQCLGLGPTKAANKYGYSKQWYFETLHAYLENGSAALMPKTRGPKTNYVRTENVVTQVIRHRFLDPDANCAVIAQKMKQTGIKVSQRSVERIINEHGLQKKTLPVSSQGSTAKS